MEAVRERIEDVRTDAMPDEICKLEESDAVTVEERDWISRLARAVGLRIDVTKIRDRGQALWVIQTLELLRSRMK